MNINWSSRWFFLLIVGILVLFLFIIIPINLSYSIKAVGKVFPAREWTVYKGTDGQLMTTLTNYELGLNTQFSSLQFERSDAANFFLESSLLTGKKILQGDTLGYVNSDHLESELVRLEGELTAAKASLNLNLTGEKESIITEAKNRIEYSIRIYEEQKKIFDRLEKLFEKKLISQEEYEIERGKLELNKIEIDLAEARLQTLGSGAKEEQIELSKSIINSIENQIVNVKKRLGDYTLQSPIVQLTINPGARLRLSSRTMALETNTCSPFNGFTSCPT